MLRRAFLQDQLTLVTNDQRMPTVVLPVEGRVAPPLSVNPSPLLFGTLRGQSATKQLVITGKQPFRSSRSRPIAKGCNFEPAPDVTKKVHLMPSHCRGAAAAGRVSLFGHHRDDLAQCRQGDVPGAWHGAR